MPPKRPIAYRSITFEDDASKLPKLKDPRRYEVERKELGEKMVKVIVGSDRKTYLVHENALCEHSLFFETSCKEEWKDGQDSAIPLPDDAPDVVSLYIHWTYCGQIFSRRATQTSQNIGDESRLLVDAYVFGEKIQDGRFKDVVLDAIIKSAAVRADDGLKYFPGQGAIGKAFSGTMAGSPLRRLMVDFWARNASHSWIKEDMQEDFLADLARELLLLRPVLTDQHPTDGNTNTCSYHQHGDGRPCYSEEVRGGGFT